MPRATAFGLDVASNAPLSFLEGASAAETGRSLELAYQEAGEPPWPDEGRLIADQRDRDGSVVFQIEAGDAGYRIHGPAYGCNVISGDGRHLRGTAGADGLAGWQRLLVAQALPFAAVLQGLEVLHASAVVVDGRAILLAGASGVGKTSAALALQRLGATLLADDVVALELAEGGLLAHPGAPIAGIDSEEVERLGEDGAGLGPILATNARERVSRADLASAPAPVGRLYLLRRAVEEAGPPSVDEEVDPRELLTSTFNLVLESPRRLVALLEVCARLAAAGAERVTCGPGTDPDELASFLLRRLGER